METVNQWKRHGRFSRTVQAVCIMIFSPIGTSRVIRHILPVGNALVVLFSATQQQELNSNQVTRSRCSMIPVPFPNWIGAFFYVVERRTYQQNWSNEDQVAFPTSEPTVLMAEKGP